MRVYSLGPGNRSVEELVELVKKYEIQCVVDVRSFPRSSRHPQFNRIALGRSLDEAGIGYLWEGQALGGMRKERARSRHIAIQEPGFRAYASHMETDAFRAGVARLIARAQDELVAIMCAERAPDECHRSYLSDFLTTKGVEVVHAIEINRSKKHELRSSVRMEGDVIVYDKGTTGLLF